MFFSILIISIVALLLAVLLVPSIRRLVLTPSIMKIMVKALPTLGQTERIALEAGTVWWDAELFSGAPNWDKLLSYPQSRLSEEEKSFMQGPVEELCKMLQDWEVEKAQDLPEPVWDFIKKNRFFGMIIPKEYGGLGFSARAHADVITKLASRSITASVTVMVPNSLGPAELLLNYGTDEQKRHYLPRLAVGEEIPCFSLTEPEAGSDAASAQSHGIICRGNYQGRDVLGMRLNWNKRYITLSPIATLIGLAFQLHDPEKLLGGQEDLGITCALIPASLPGIEIGKRHDPLGIPFQNGPHTGHDVFVPLDFIIGGEKMAGKGWRMLMESLGAGRGISLPSLAVGAAQVSTRLIGAYATIREQFNMPIGRFEGVEEPIARIAGLTYLMNATRSLTLSALDAGEKPAVVTAIVKAYLTENMRQVINDAMDVQAGAAIMRGPRNILGTIYQSAPISITVEGANILTRSMIIYGQGAIRCHPFVQHEMRAIAENNLDRFDHSFFGHMGFILKNSLRAFLFGLTGAVFARSPKKSSVKKYFRRMTHMSCAFSVISDVAMASIGGQLKRKEKICGRMADALAWMYMASATLKKFHDEGEPKEDLPYARWSLEHALFLIENALGENLQNFPNRFLGILLKLLVFPFGLSFNKPHDRLVSEAAQGILDGKIARLNLSPDIFIPMEKQGSLGDLEAALQKIVEVQPIERKIHAALKSGKLKKQTSSRELLESALRALVISSEEYEKVKSANRLRWEAIQVDAF